MFSSQEKIKYKYSDARLPSSNKPETGLKPGDECEVLMESKSENEPSYWYPGNVKMQKGEFFVIELKDLNQTEISPSEKIRSPNKK